ncbi:MAG: response regulator transcription factor [Pseudomonadota bacterium]
MKTKIKPPKVYVQSEENLQQEELKRVGLAKIVSHELAADTDRGISNREVPPSTLAVGAFGAMTAVNSLFFNVLHTYILHPLTTLRTNTGKEPHIIWKLFIEFISYVLGGGMAFFSLHASFFAYLLTPLFYLFHKIFRCPTKNRFVEKCTAGSRLIALPQNQQAITFKVADLENRKMQTVLVVEDHPLFRDALSQFLKSAIGAAEVITANSAEHGLDLAESFSELNLILLDVGLPGLSGADAVAAFHKRYPLIPILILSASDDQRVVAAALRAGAQAFISKTTDPEILAEVVRRVLAKESLESEWIMSALCKPSSDESLPSITQRQQEVLGLLLQGCSNKEIARSLDLAQPTVKLHVSSIFRILNVASRTQAIIAARRLGLDSLQ